jgi:hypothetical protein
VSLYNIIRNFLSKAAKNIAYKFLNIQNTNNSGTFREFRRIAKKGVNFKDELVAW